MKDVFITCDIPGNYKTLLEKNGLSFSVWNSSKAPSKKELLNEAKNAKALISSLNDSLDEEFFESCTHLKAVANYAVGHNNIDLLKAPCPVSNTPDVLTQATAELALTLALSASRNLRESFKEVYNHRFEAWQPKYLCGPGLYKKRVGVFGAGRIGKCFGKMCESAFSCEVIYSTSRSGPSLQELISTVDLLSLHCPLTPQTQGLLNYNVLMGAKRNLILVNTARAQLVVEEDLIKALDNKIIYHYATDVTDPEPLGAGHPFLNRKDISITPHIGSATFETRSEMGRMCAKNIIAALKGEKMPQQIN